MASESNELLTCPFCDFTEKNDYQLLLHVEVHHSETGESPFAIKDEIEAARSNRSQNQVNEESTSEDESGQSTPSHLEFIACPYQCGEQIPINDMQFHTDFHLAEEMANNDSTAINITSNFSTDISTALRNHDQVLSRVQTPMKDKHWTTSLKDMFSIHRMKLSMTNDVQPEEVRRLGRAELGPYANEKRMPSWLVRLLEDGAKATVSNKIGHDGRLIRVETVSNETPNLIPVLARLSKVDKNVTRAFYCNPFVRHISKLPNEGGFCGYRNIQMLISYIRDAEAYGFEHFAGKRIPSILRLQDMIEKAWDQGYNSSGRIETGGIRMTRKYIGTPEAQALLLSLGIPAEAQAFSAKNRKQAYTAMIEAICKHFDDGTNIDNSDKVVITDKPPLFFQHQGHSMTVVGVELDIEYRANLVVFDPMYSPVKHLKNLALNNRLTFTSTIPEKLMKPHRRDEKYLGRYKAFEMIKINGPV